MAAENSGGASAGSAAGRRFNEAAAHGRGKLVDLVELLDRQGLREPAASMRPRRMAAENSSALGRKIDVTELQ